MIARRLSAMGTPDPRGWAFARPGRSRRIRGFASILLAIPLVLGLVGLPANAPVTRGDELSDARAQQAQLKKEVAAQKEAVAQLKALQNGLSAEISQTKAQLNGINADLSKVKLRINRMATKITAVKTAYNALVVRLASLDARLAAITASEQRKQSDLRQRQALLADRVRAAYDTDRTSLLETFLSGGTFTDLLAEMSNVVDVGEQDKALAQQIAKDQEVLQALHQAVMDTRTQTDDLRVETAAQKAALDKSLAALKVAKLQLARLEKQVSRELARQKAAYAAVQRNAKDAARALAAAAAAQKKLTTTINKIIARQAQQGNIPSEYNGTLEWPMVGDVTQNFGCTGFAWEPAYGSCAHFHQGIDIVAPYGTKVRASGDVTQNFGCTGFAWEPAYGSCAHFHQGIDIVAPYGTKVRASGDGVVAYIGWNYADGADPAWIVIIAHSAGLQTWYAHLQPKYPGNISEGSHVSAGQVIGYEGNTGHSTGAHLHWAVRLNDTFVNPRLFL